MNKVTIVNENPWKGQLVLGIVVLVIGALIAIGGQGSLELVLMISGALIAIASLSLIFLTLGSASWLGIGLSVAGFILGVAMVAVPNFFSDMMMVMLAVMVIVMGLFTLFASVSPLLPTPLKALGLVAAFAMLIVGFLALYNPKETADVVMAIVGIVLVVSGALSIYKALKQRNRGSQPVFSRAFPPVFTRWHMSGRGGSARSRWMRAVHAGSRPRTGRQGISRE